MPSLYRVMYVTEPEGAQVSVPVSATSQANAVAAAQTADATFSTLVDVEVEEENIIVGS